MTGAISFVWAIFAAVFFYLGYASWKISQETFQSFKSRGEDLADESEEFNRYIDKLNAKWLKRNQTSTISFFVAGFAALVSMVLFFYR